MKMVLTNWTHVSDFALAAYVDVGPLKPLCFTVVLCLYAVVVGANVLLVVVVSGSRSLHEPMYVFLCSLCVNELLGGTSLFPFLLLQILADTHAVSAPVCLLQVFCVYTYGSVEFTNLAVMSYDRFLAVCRPLRYSSRMTPGVVSWLVAVIWLPPVLAVSVSVGLTASLQLCGGSISKVYCDNYSIVRLSCSDTTVNNVYELVAASLTVCAPLGVVLYTYLQILRVCFRGSAQTRHKALSTCSPHLASLLNFSFAVSFHVLSNRFDLSAVPSLLHVFLSVYFLTCQPLFNPVMYGLNLSKIRVACKRLFLGVKFRLAPR